MAGITNQPFRRLCRRFGCGMAYTEMVSAKGLHYGGENSFSLLHREDEAGPLGIQIFGSDPAVMAEQVASDTLQSFDVIDINMGCPAGKIIRNGDGSALMKDIPRAERIIRACVAASRRPVTV
jgi:tRNA-dihydrouridine synthase